MKGVPLRVEVGNRDVEQRACVTARRDRPGKAGKVNTGGGEEEEERKEDEEENAGVLISFSSFSSFSSRSSGCQWKRKHSSHT